jgi:ADP-heptose:LPS heptosyltransferase
MAIRAQAVVGNDAGLTHLAAAARRAAGKLVAEVHVIFASTDPSRTGAPGARFHRMEEPPPCWPCYRKNCGLGLVCMGVTPAQIRAAITEESSRGT